MRVVYHCYRLARGLPGRSPKSRDLPITIDLLPGQHPQDDSAWDMARRVYACSMGCPLDQVEQDGCLVLP
jgi:hypothetical protein